MEDVLRGRKGGEGGSLGGEDKGRKRGKDGLLEGGWE